ncbi:putative protein-serine/threonine phosphatase [Helianthus anomalus]
MFRSEKDLVAPSLEDKDSDSINKNSCEYQSCNVSDFFISDMIFSSSPIDEPTCLPDYGCDESRCRCGKTDLWTKVTKLAKRPENSLFFKHVFRLQVNNGIPIKSWFSDPSDCALITILLFLETLADAEDVRPLIAKRFGNKEQMPLFFIILLQILDAYHPLRAALGQYGKSVLRVG